MQIIYEEGELSEDQVREMLRAKALEVGGQKKLAEMLDMDSSQLNRIISGYVPRSGKYRNLQRVPLEATKLLGLRREIKINHVFTFDA